MIPPTATCTTDATHVIVTGVETVDLRYLGSSQASKDEPMKNIDPKHLDPKHDRPIPDIDPGHKKPIPHNLDPEHDRLRYPVTWPAGERERMKKKNVRVCV